MERLPLLDLARDKVVVLDGAMGTSIQAARPDPDAFEGRDGCNELLVHTRPDLIRSIHAGFLRVGCDIVETNSFSANGVVLAEYSLADRTEELNHKAAALARSVANDFSTQAQPRYVLGSVGPGTKLPSLGQITFDELVAAFQPQMRGLLSGGADAICIETCQDLLQIKSAIQAARNAFAQAGRSLPLFVSITVENTGTMLLGSDIQAAVAALWPLGIDVLGLNCASGPSTMKRHAEQLGRVGPELLMAMPNAGLPENVDGELVYRLSAEEFGRWVEGFVREDAFRFVGGCCGTTPAHLAELVVRVSSLSPPLRQVRRGGEVSSLFQAVPLRQAPAPLLVGERTNANGSKEFRDRLLADDVDGMLAVAREQGEGGAHLLDVSVAYVGRDEGADMERFVGRLVQASRLPLSIDSTDPVVIEKALKLCGGRCLVNSINLEDGDGRLDRIATLAKRFGAALVALAIDEKGMAMTADRKLEVAQRIYDRCVNVHGLAPQDLVFDMLTFTVASGDSSTRKAAVETLDALARFKRRHPDVHTLLGVSNVSFGLKPAARRVLTSVFLHMAVERGLDQAIVNARNILPLYRIEPATRDAAVRLLNDDWSAGDPLSMFISLFEGGNNQRTADDHLAEEVPPDQRLFRMVVDGSQAGLGPLLDGLVTGGREPLGIINSILIPAMKEVGDLFGSGQMQLPFVLQSAQVMKAAVGHLQQHMKGNLGRFRGTLVLATVKGDVHDIGKNLVEIIVSNNGFEVADLGTKVEIEAMVKAVREHRADAVGMSGLLVKSTVVMKENIEEMKRLGMTIPVLLGGAALTRSYVEGPLRSIYGPKVSYCQDAFDGLAEMIRLEKAGAPASVLPATEGDELSPAPAPQGRLRLDVVGGGDELPAPDIDRTIPIPVPPFLGSRLLDFIPLDEVLPLVNETTLFRGQWRYRRGSLSKAEYDGLIEREVRPVLAELARRSREEGLLQPKAVYGYFRCVSRRRSLVLLDESGGPAHVFPFPRRRTAPHISIADYFRPEGGEADIVALFAVTAGNRAAEEAQSLYRANRYRDYLHLHGLAVEVAEAAAEWLHRRIRLELGIAGSDQEGSQARVRQGYRGSRYSFGYPACPDLALQRPLFELIEPQRIGVELSDSLQMIPEYSVTALVAHHPDARYFDLG
ncbi:MAG: methionine synthase [Deltaproteobacteria bacterium]|nr:methionine synthase [Deltaproteobacteria bacterium]